MADHEHDDRDEAAPERTQAEMAARDRRQADQRKSEPEYEPDAEPAELRREAERLRATLKETTRKATADRLRKEELEREREERETEKLGETEKLKKQAREATERVGAFEKETVTLKQQLNDLRVDHAIEREATSLFEYPEDVPKLIDRARIEIDPETGRIVGVKEAVKKLAEARPGLLRNRPGGGTPPRESLSRSRQGGSLSQDAYQTTIADSLRETGLYGPL